MKIYNTLTRQKEEFVPLHPGHVRMYVCGMTVYDYCHLGHARVLVAFDVITRYLRARGWKVTYVRNITDIDDKILRRADENQEKYSQLTTRFIDAMHEDERKLGVISPDIEPRATAHIDEMVDMISTLVKKGYAYQGVNKDGTLGDVFYKVERFSGYGQLSGKHMDELLAGARVEVDEAKKDPRDFALWKAVAVNDHTDRHTHTLSADNAHVHWPSPWGPGRPGWHIECSAMSTCCLGETFDIHGGGPDLPFPHHENEIAQSEAATGKKYVNYWMHAGAVRVNNEKMSKSLGNFFTIREILDKYHPEVVRYLLLASHYRSAINYSEENLQLARGALERFYMALRGLDAISVKPLADLNPDNAYVKRFISHMDDDFATPEAVAVLFDIARALNAARAANDSEQVADLALHLRSLSAVFGILQADPDNFLKAGAAGELDAQAIENLIAERNQAKKDKNFARSDAIRDELKAKGIVLEDSRAGTTWRRE